MTSKGRLLGIAAALCIAAAAGAGAATPHDHGRHAASGLELSLDNGRKWQTDAPLQRGMTEIRAAMAGALDAIHGNNATPSEYEKLATGIAKQIDYVTENCRLPEAADAELHVILARILEGVDDMQGNADRRGGAIKVVEALDAYGDFFDQPGWTKLSH